MLRHDVISCNTLTETIKIEMPVDLQSTRGDAVDHKSRGGKTQLVVFCSASGVKGELWGRFEHFDKYLSLRYIYFFYCFSPRGEKDKNVELSRPTTQTQRRKPPSEVDLVQA